MWKQKQHYIRNTICLSSVEEQNCRPGTSFHELNSYLCRDVVQTWQVKTMNHSFINYYPTSPRVPPKAIAVNNNVFFVNSSGMCSRCVRYISNHWEPLSLQSHNHVPSQHTEDHITRTVCLYMMEGEEVFCLEGESSPMSGELCIYSWTSREELCLCRAVCRTKREVHLWHKILSANPPKTKDNISNTEGST